MVGDDNSCWLGHIFCLPLNVISNSLILTLPESRACLMKYINMVKSLMQNMNSDVIQQ
jgi:hypothetical protein